MRFQKLPEAHFFLDRPFDPAHEAMARRFSQRDLMPWWKVVEL